MSLRSIKRILMIGWEYPPFNSGGLGTACQGLAEALSRKGIKVFFALPQKVEVFSLGVKFLFPKKNYREKLPPQFYTYSLVSSFNGREKNQREFNSLIERVEWYGRRIANLAKSLNFDIIHAHDWLSVPAALAIQKITAKPLILHVHALEFDRSGGFFSGDSEIGRIEKEGLEKADNIIAVSNYTKKKIIECYDINPSKIKVVHNGVKQGIDTEILGHGIDFFKDKKVVIFVGRLTIQKGADWFLRAAKRALEKEPNTLFVIVGEGELKPQAVELANQLGISKNVIFTGFLDQQKLGRIYQLADLYVLPSVSEPFGITPLEALKHNTPLILSKNAGVSEVLNGALKVDFWDVEQMAGKIVALLRYPTLQRQLIQDGKNDLAKLTWDKAAEKVVNIYKNFS